MADTYGMGFLLAELLVLAAVAVAALVVAAPGPMWLGVLGACVPIAVGMRLLEGSVAVTTIAILLVVHLPLTWLALSAAQVLGSTRATAKALAAPTPSVDHVLPGLAALCREAAGLGFEPVPEGVVWLGENQLAVHVHPDGTRAELIQRDGLEPGFGLGTEFEGGTSVESVPWDHGIADDRIRVAGASLAELLSHHRAAVAERVAAGQAVAPAPAHEALRRATESDVADSTQMLARPLRNAMVVALQQTPLKGLVGR